MVARAILSFHPAPFHASGESPAKSNYSRTYGIPQGWGICRFPCQTNSQETIPRLSLLASHSFLPALLHLSLPATVGIPVSRNHGRKLMNPIAIAALILGLLLVGLVVWVLLRLVGDQKENEALESQMSELRRDLLTLSATQAQSTTKLETIAGTVATRLEAVTTALKDGVKDSAQSTPN